MSYKENEMLGICPLGQEWALMFMLIAKFFTAISQVASPLDNSGSKFTISLFDMDF
jgi:hypothetical protein